MNVIYGTKANDVINAPLSNAYVFGDNGNDIIHVGAMLSFPRFQPEGSTLYGNDGADIFSFTQSALGFNEFLKTTIGDFSAVEGDKIRIDSTIINSYTDVLSILSQDINGDAVLNMSGGIVIEDLAASQITATMFEFI